MNDILKASLAFAVAFIIVVAVAPMMISYLRKLKAGQQIITEFGPTWHKGKQGTPTMGGLIFIFAVIVSYLVFGFSDILAGKFDSAVCLLVGLIFAAIGFGDDYIKIVKKHNEGLTERQKIILQTFTAAAFVVYLAIKRGGNTEIPIPFIDKSIDISYFYYVFAMVAILATINAVNFTDGLDGLCTGVSIPVMVFFAFVAYVTLRRDVSVLSAAVAGSLLGFLLFNRYPAKVMMGDTGSMFIGSTVACLAFLLDMPLMIIVVGFMYCVEMATVVIQRTYFKITKGKRLFKMTPIHHQFEMDGYSEVQIDLIFSGITVVLCVLAALSYVL